MPLVSVILPGYNHAPFLRERIESVLCQDFEDFEVIMLDDCSTDGSADIMLSYKSHPKVSHVIINEQNTGNTFLQWDKGVSMAHGKYIWIAESDDVAEKTLLSTLVSRLEQEGAVMAFCYSHFIDAESKLMSGDPSRVRLYRAPGIYDGQDFAKKRLAFACLVYNASMVVWRKDCYDKVNKDFMKQRHGGDWMFWFEVCRQGKVVEVPEYLNMFRQHERKVTRDAQATGDGYREITFIQRYILDELKATPYQRRVVRGRLTQRLKRAHDKMLYDELSQMYPDIYGGTLGDVVCYNIDKLFNFSGYQYH